MARDIMYAVEDHCQEIYSPYMKRLDSCSDELQALKKLAYPAQLKILTREIEDLKYKELSTITLLKEEIKEWKNKEAALVDRLESITGKRVHYHGSLSKSKRKS